MDWLALDLFVVRPSKSSQSPSVLQTQGISKHNWHIHTPSHTHTRKLTCQKDNGTDLKFSKTCFAAFSLHTHLLHRRRAGRKCKKLYKLMTKRRNSLHICSLGAWLAHSLLNECWSAIVDGVISVFMLTSLQHTDTPERVFISNEWPLAVISVTF